LGNRFETLSVLLFAELLTSKTFAESKLLKFKDPTNLYLPADDPSEEWYRFAAGTDNFGDEFGEGLFGTGFENNRVGLLVALVEKWSDGLIGDVGGKDWNGDLGVGLGRLVAGLEREIVGLGDIRWVGRKWVKVGTLWDG